MIHRDDDAYGFAIEEHSCGRGVTELVERDHGWIDVTKGAPAYFAEFDDWPTRQRRAAAYVRGKILDMGCGAGRVALHFQDLGYDVVGIDVSPRAVKVCRRRGVRNVRHLPVSQVSSRLGMFATIVLFGGDFGLLENPRRALCIRHHDVDGRFADS